MSIVFFLNASCILKTNVVQATVYKTVYQIVDAYKGLNL